MEHQISMFDDEPLSWFEECLQRGSLTAGGKVRIYGASLYLSNTDLATFLKEEYGLSGFSTKDGFADFAPKGMRLYKFHSEYEENYSWADVAKGIKKLISIDRYLTDKEKEEVKQIQLKHDGILPCPKARYGYI